MHAWSRRAAPTVMEHLALGPSGRALTGVDRRCAVGGARGLGRPPWSHAGSGRDVWCPLDGCGCTGVIRRTRTEKHNAPPVAGHLFDGETRTRTGDTTIFSHPCARPACRVCVGVCAGMTPTTWPATSWSTWFAGLLPVPTGPTMNRYPVRSPGRLRPERTPTARRRPSVSRPAYPVTAHVPSTKKRPAAAERMKSSVPTAFVPTVAKPALFWIDDS
jgi:hypothetical protein